MDQNQVRHMVIFKLKHRPGSERALQFLADGQRILTAIPGVENFQVYDQVSKKNNYDYGFSMDFANQTVYDGYNLHSDHVDFVEQRWKQEVEDFLEIDFRDR